MHNTFRKTVCFSVLAFLMILSVNSAATGAENSAKKDIAVKDYTWKTSGRGTMGVLKDITLKNLSLNEYKNIQVEIDLYTREGNPDGSLRTTLKEILPAGSEKTYYNVRLGIMNSDLAESTAKIVSAEEKDAGPISKIGQSILVRDVKFSDIHYGTEAFIESITLQNNTNQDYKKIILKISALGVSGAKAGYEGYVTKATINRILPANSTVTVKGINVGFTHPDAKDRYVVVSEATPVSKKELKYLYAEQKDSIEIEKGSADFENEKKLSLVERYREELKRNNIEVNTGKGNQAPNDDIQFSIEEEVEPEQLSVREETSAPDESTPDNIDRVEVRDKKEETVPEFEDTGEISNSGQAAKRMEIATSDTRQDIPESDTDNKDTGNPDIQDDEESNTIQTVAEPETEEIAGSSTETGEMDDSAAVNSSVKNTASAGRDESVESGSSDIPSSQDSGISGNDGTGNTAGTGDSSTGISSDSMSDNAETEEVVTVPARSYEVAFGADEVPLPKRDIVVRDFSWGSGVPGTIGKLRKLTLENISTLTYTDIDILVEYFSPQGTPLGSSQFLLKDDILKPGETKDFRNLDVGLVQLIPNEASIKISIRTAKDIY